MYSEFLPVHVVDLDLGYRYKHIIIIYINLRHCFCIHVRDIIESKQLQQTSPLSLLLSSEKAFLLL